MKGLVLGFRNFVTRWASYLIVVVALCLTAWFFIANLQHTSANTFEVFYFAATDLHDGVSVYGSQTPHLKSEYIYPPLFAFLCLPFLKIELHNATRVWLVIDVVLTWFALLLGAREILRRFLLPVSWRACITLASGAFLLSVGEIRTEWATGQTDTLVLAAFVLALCWIDRIPWLAGLALGLGANIKYQPLLALPWLMARRRWRAAGFTVLFSLGCAMLPAFASGWAWNLNELRKAFTGLGSFAGINNEIIAPSGADLTWIRSISVTSAIGRLLQFFNLDPGGAFFASGAVALLFFGLVWWVYRKHSLALLATAPVPSFDPSSRGIVACEWVGLMVAWLTLGPQVSRRHMFVLILLHLLALGLLYASPPGRNRKLLIAGLVVWQIGLRLPPAHFPWFQNAADAWMGMGGPSWCLLGFYGVLVWGALEWAASVPGVHVYFPTRVALSQE